MILSLSVRNFQKLGTASFTFGPGLNLIVGPNWAGKSTVLRAILYALGGGRAVRVKSEDLITRGCSDVEVCLTLETEDGPIEIVRGTKRTLVKDADGKVLASGHPAVTGLLEDRLGLTVKDFISFRVTEQGEPDALLRAGSAALSAYINRATGADVIDQAVAWLGAVQSEASGFVAGAEGLQDALRGQEAEAVRWQEYGAGLARAIAESTEIVMQNRLPDWEAYLKGLVEQDQAHRQEQAAIRELEARPCLVPEAPGVERPEAGKLGRLRDEQYLISVQERAISDLRSQNVPLNHRHMSLEREGHLLSKEVTETILPDQPEDGALAKAEQELAALGSELANLKQAKAGSACPTCRRLYDETFDVATTEARIAELEGRQAELSREKEQLVFQEMRWKSTQYRLEQHHVRLAQIKSELVEIEARQSDLKAQYDKLVSVHGDPDALSRLGASLTAQVQELEKATTIWELYERGLARSEQEQARVAAELAERRARCPAAVSAETLSTAQETVQALRTERALHEQRIAESQKQLALAEETVARIQTQIEAMRAQLAKVAEQEKRAECAARLIKVLRKNRDAFLQQTWDALLSYASEFIRIASGGDMTEMRRSELGQFQYVERGEVFPIEVASGMQTSILGVALKLALGAAIAGKAELLLLDEVTAAGSAENSATLVDLLRSQAGQTILVTHRAADAAMADRVVGL